MPSPSKSHITDPCAKAVVWKRLRARRWTGQKMPLGRWRTCGAPVRARATRNASPQGAQAELREAIRGPRCLSTEKVDVKRLASWGEASSPLRPKNWKQIGRGERI